MALNDLFLKRDEKIKFIQEKVRELDNKVIDEGNLLPKIKALETTLIELDSLNDQIVSNIPDKPHKVKEQKETNDFIFDVRCRLNHLGGGAEDSYDDVKALLKEFINSICGGLGCIVDVVNAVFDVRKGNYRKGAVSVGKGALNFAGFARQSGTPANKLCQTVHKTIKKT